VSNWCGRGISDLFVQEGQPISFYCHQCKDIVASGVTEMFKALLDAVQSSQRSLKYEIEATDSSVNGLDDKLYDIRSQISSLDDKINNIRGE